MEKQSKEDFLKEIHSQFPQLELVRQVELRRQAKKIFNDSLIGKSSGYLYFGIAVVSFVLLWTIYRFNIIFSFIAAIIIWFVATAVLDWILFKLSGLENRVREASDKDIDGALNNLRGTILK